MTDYPQPDELTVHVSENNLPKVTFVYEEDGMTRDKAENVRRAGELFSDHEPVPFVANFFGVIVSGEARPARYASRNQGSRVVHEFNFEATRPHVPGKSPAIFCKQRR